MDPQALVRRTVQNEISDTGNGQHFMYKDSTVYKDHSITKEVIETNEGGLSRTIARNGHPLTPQQQAAVDQKLTKFANDAEARRKREEASKVDDQRSATLMRSLPDAFLYTYAGIEKGPKGHEFVRLDFKPNPNWSAPNHETRVLEGMQGTMVIDKNDYRIAEINGELFRGR